MKRSIDQIRKEALEESKKEVEKLINRLPKEKRPIAQKEIITGRIPKIRGGKMLKVPSQKHGLNRPKKETLGEVIFRTSQESQVQDQTNNNEEIVMKDAEVQSKKVGRPEMYSRDYVRGLINEAKTAGRSFTGYIKDQYKDDPKKAASKCTAIYLAAKRHGLLTKKD
jgi:hypothetical protein